MKQGMTVIGEYCDRALSGKTDNRPEFLRMIKDSERHQFEAVIMYTLDRFARNRYDSAMYKAKLKKNGVKLYYAAQPMPDTPETIILESLMEGLAEYYSENLARGVRRGLKENALNGLSVGAAGLCVGYQIVDKKYVVDPVGAKAVQMAFGLYADNKNFTEIAAALNEKGFKTLRGNGFTVSAVRTMLHNDRYIGVYKYGDVRQEGGYPAIISRDLYDTVQAKLKHNARARASGKAREDYLLTGKLFCGMCGSAMVGDCAHSKSGKPYTYYRCNKKKKCNKKMERKEWIEEFVVKFTLENFLTDETISYIADKVFEIAEKEYHDTSIITGLNQRLKDVRSRKQNLLNAIEQGVILPTTKERLAELEGEELEVEGLIAKEEMKKPLLTRERIVYWLNSFRSGDIKDMDYQRHIIDTLVNSVYVYDTDNGGKKLVLTYNVSGKARRFECSDIGQSAYLDTQYPNTLFYTSRVVGFIVEI